MEASQYPQAPTPETWSLLASVWVEHQGVVSPSIVVQPVCETPMKLKGKAQAEPTAGPSVVKQLVPEPVPVSVPDPDPANPATAAIWHLKPPPFFLLFDLNWTFRVLASLEAGMISPNPSANDP